MDIEEGRYILFDKAPSELSGMVGVGGAAVVVVAVVVLVGMRWGWIKPGLFWRFACSCW